MAKIIFNNIIPVKGVDDVINNMLTFDQLPQINSPRWLDLEPLEGEVWIDVPNYVGFYKISCYGRILSLPRTLKRGAGGYYRKERILRLKKAPSQFYYRVNLFDEQKNCKDFFVHRLVAISFLGDKSPKFVNHIDENKQNPILSNLEWVTPRTNSNHGNAIKKMLKTFIANGVCKPVALLSESGSILKTYDSITNAARDLNMKPTGIVRACKRHGKYDGLIFRYLNEL